MDYVYIGRVANTHGVRGGLKIFPTTDEPMRFKMLDEVILEDLKGNDKSYKILDVKFSGKLVILQLEGVTDMNQAQMMKQQIVKIPKEWALPLEENEYYVQDLVGLEVYENDVKIGVMKDVMFTGANDVYVIELDDGRELLLPYIEECVLGIDLEANRMDVHIMKGLL